MLLWFLVTLLAPQGAWALPVLPGDINLDGKVNVSDVQCHVLASANPDEPPSCMKASAEDADVSCDGSLNVSDLQLSVLLAVGNPLSSVVDQDGDSRVDACDPDRDGDSWSDDCESAAGTDINSPDSHPNSASECAGAVLSTACRLEGSAGEQLRCDLRLARQSGTLGASLVEAILQVDPAIARIVKLDTVKGCEGADCTYGGAAPPQDALPNDAPLLMMPTCTALPCDQAWSLGKIGVSIGADGGPPLNDATWNSPGTPLSGDAFVLSVLVELLVDSSDAKLEVFDGEAARAAELFTAGLRPSEGIPALVTQGPPSGTPCSSDAECDDDDACTEDLCAGGICDHTTTACDDQLACTVDTCSATGCEVSLEEGSCVFAGSCLNADHINCAPLVRLSEVATLGDEGWVELVHEGAATIRLDGFALSTGGAPWPVPSVTLAPFENVIIHVGSGIDTPNEVFAGEALSSLSEAGGEVVLWRNNALVDYVAWGQSSYPTLEIAGASGVWSHSEALVIDAVPPGYTLQSNSDAGATAWNAAEATPLSNTIPCAIVPCVEVACHESEDGDFDGDADCEDIDCASVPGCAAGQIELCDDGADNDNNGLADCLDPACALGEACPALPTLSEVIFDDEGSFRIEVTNLDVAPLPMDAIVLCSADACVTLQGGDSLYPSSFLTVHSGSGQDSPTERWLDGALGLLTRSSGELLLSTESPPTASSTLSYVRWSNAPNASTPEGSLEPLATEAAIWAPDTRIYSDALHTGDSLARDPNGAGLAWEWDIHQSPSPGSGNPNCGSPGQCRESRCEDAVDEDGDEVFDCLDSDCDGWPGCEERVVLNEVRFPSEGALAAIEIANLGEGAASLLDRHLATAEESFSLAGGVSLAPGEVLVIYTGGGDESPETLYGLPFTLSPSAGELSLRHGELSDYVRWGASSGALEADAVAAAQWVAGESVDTALIDESQAALRYDGWGERASDWSISADSLGEDNGIEFGRCGDGEDNDSDTLFDCWDPDCETSEFCEGELCGNGLDDDNNGDTDCEDIFCADKGFCIENGQCDDTIDNDGDGLTDCADLDDCGDSGVCDEGLHCADGIDNDLNGATDCEDSACIGDAACIESGNCADGVDNDGNGLTDCEELDACGGALHCIEPLNCDDGIDNDVDGLTDCEDIEDCDGQTGCVEVYCGDLIDDDGDGAIDWDDDECALLPICVGAEPILTLTELYLESPGGGHVIELANLGPATSQASGIHICSALSCFELPEGTDIKPGEYLLIETGEAADFEGHRFTGELLSELSPSEGWLQLLSTSPPSGPADLLDFVQWGASGQAQEALAVEASQWVAGEAIPSTTYVPGLTSFTWLGTGEGAEHWVVHFVPSPGEANPDCEEPGVCAEISCEDGLDNDGDSFVDCADGDCSQTPTCLVEANHCNDALDNDGDGLVDCADNLECGQEPHCDEALACGDQADNDLNGLVDCEDPACDGHPLCSEGLNCADQKDNDEDGLYDCEDPECADDPHCRETDDECDDLYDNDQDGALDCDDSDCVGSLACLEAGKCWDAVDNDGDGATDCADDACRLTSACAPRARLSEIAFNGGGQGTVEIANPGVGEVETAYLWVCVNATCVQLPEYLALLPSGATLSVNSGPGDEIAGQFYTGEPWGLEIAGGSARLYGSTDAAGAPAYLLDYVAWGSPGQEGATEAVALGRWPADIAVPTEHLSLGRSIGRYGVTHEPWRWAVWPTPRSTVVDSSTARLSSALRPGAAMATTTTTTASLTAMTRTAPRARPALRRATATTAETTTGTERSTATTRRAHKLRVALRQRASLSSSSTSPLAATPSS